MIANLKVQAQKEIILYPDGALESNGIIKEESMDQRGFVTNITQARMYAFFPPKEKATGASVLICPGGAYIGISAQKEGYDIAEWFNEKGIAAFVLYYRMPNGHSEIPLKDAQTAMELIRSNAKEWGLKKNKIGVMGFSAGGHLAATLGTKFTKNSRPNFMILAYPVISMDNKITHGGSRQNLLGKAPSEELVKLYSSELHVQKKTPTTFLVHAKDDSAVPAENSIRMLNALVEKHIQAELHVFNKGGHGFGMRKTGHDVDQWSEYLNEFLVKNNLAK